MPRIFLLQQELFLQQDRLEEDIGRAQAKHAGLPALDIEKDIFAAPTQPPPKPIVSSVEVVKNHFEIRDLTSSEQYHHHEYDHDDEKEKDSDDEGPTQIEGTYSNK